MKSRMQLKGIMWRLCTSGDWKQNWLDNGIKAAMLTAKAQQIVLFLFVQADSLGVDQ